MAEITDKIMHIMGKKINVISDQQRLRPENSEVLRLWGDNSLITSLTDFRPGYSIDQGLKSTVEWFTGSGNINKYKSDIYNV